MAIKEWIDRKGQNAVVNNEIKDWDKFQVRHYGSRTAIGENPGFETDIQNEKFLGQIQIRIDGWKGQSEAELDLVGKADVIDIQVNDKFKFTNLRNEKIELVVNAVEQFGDTLELGLKYA